MREITAEEMSSGTYKVIAFETKERRHAARVDFAIAELDRLMAERRVRKAAEVAA